MSRLTGNDVIGLMEAYNAVYTPQELTEEQVWEEVESWVNSLLEEGYDLSDYTWGEMYDNYIIESAGTLAGKAIPAATKLLKKVRIGNPWNQFPKKAKPQLGIPKEGPSSRLPGRTLAPAGGTNARPALPPASSKQAPGGKLATRPTSTPTAPKGSPSNPDVIKTNMNVPGGRKISGLKSGAGISAALSTADEKSKGSGWKRSLAKGATVAAGTVLGGLAGGAAGTAVAPGAGTAIGGYAGQAAGAAAADKAFDTVAGKNAAERAADRLKNRQRQAGGELKGIGGKTTFDTKKNTMTTGSGSQKKTVELAKTSVVKDPKTGKAETGFLAYKDGKAIYKRSAKPGEGSSNALERIGRTINPNAYKANDAKLAAQKLKQASASDIKRQQALGVKGSKNLVGPKIVGPKIVGTKPTSASGPAGGGMGGRRGGRP